MEDSVINIEQVSADKVKKNVSTKCAKPKALISLAL